MRLLVELNPERLVGRRFIADERLFQVVRVYCKHEGDVLVRATTPDHLRITRFFPMEMVVENLLEDERGLIGSGYEA